MQNLTFNINLFRFLFLISCIKAFYLIKLYVMFMYDVFLINNLQGKEQSVNSCKDQLVHRPTRIQKTYKHRGVKLYMDVLYDFVPRFLDTQRNQVRHILCTSLLWIIWYKYLSHILQRKLGQKLPHFQFAHTFDNWFNENYFTLLVDEFVETILLRQISLW